MTATIGGIPAAHFKFPQRCAEFPQRRREFSLSFPSARRSRKLADRRISPADQQDRDVPSEYFSGKKQNFPSAQGIHRASGALRGSGLQPFQIDALRPI